MSCESEANILKAFCLGTRKVAKAAGIWPAKEDKVIGLHLQPLLIVAKEELAGCAGHFWTVTHPQIKGPPRGKGGRHRFQPQRPQAVLNGDVQRPQMGVSYSLPHSLPGPSAPSITPAVQGRTWVQARTRPQQPVIIMSP